MPVVISLLRGVNVGGHHKIKMDALRELYESLGLKGALTYVQSGNVVCRTKERNLKVLAKRIEAGIEQTFGFHSDVILRTAVELRAVVEANPFTDRSGIESNKLAVIFLAVDPGEEMRSRVASVKVGPEELYVMQRELYIYFPEGMGRSKLPAALEKISKGSGPGTARNWNTVTKLLEMAERETS
jgi:uncharacterized protein (DUF1697 family)